MSRKTDTINIPIGVNLFDASTALVGYWTKDSIIGTTNYQSQPDSSYRRFILPYDTRAIFSQTNLANQGSNIRMLLVDQDGVIRDALQNITSPETIRNRALAVETNSIKITKLYANCMTTNLSTVQWVRTS